MDILLKAKYTRLCIVAFTEVSQTRAGNIQGARDNLRKIKYGQINPNTDMAWQFISSKNKIRSSQVVSYLRGYSC